MKMRSWLKKTTMGMMAFLMVFLSVFSSVPYANAAMQVQCENGRPVGSTMDRFADMNNLFYNPCDNGGRGACYSGGANLSGDTIMAKVVNYLNGNNPSGFVLSPIGIAGVLAGVQGESGFNPFRFQGDKVTGPAYGFAQYDPMSKITSLLSTDPRTANFFNEYFDVKYTRYDSSTGYPKEPVPEEVIDAWLAVQLDFTFGPSGEFETTKVSGYRNLGGRMGLDYIDGNMNLHQAMDAAQTPEDATRIWVWIYERPGDKEGASNGRSKTAQGWLNYVNNMISSPAEKKTDTTSSNGGNNVTIIGDSLIANSQSKIAEKMPQAQIDAQSGRSFADGISVLQNLANNNQLRNYVVFAVGTDSSVTSEQAQQVVDIVGSSKKVVFITNYSTSNAYVANNNVFTKMKNDNSNVLLADWKSSASSQSSSLLSADGVTPTEAGQSMIATLIANNISMSSPAYGMCGDVGSINGGLTEAQAKALADYYNGPSVTISEWNLTATSNRKTNCVAFSYFFVQRFTSIGHTDYSIFFPNGNFSGGGNGVDAAPALAMKRSLPSGNSPRPFSVFSVSKGTLNCGQYKCGHTGIIVAVNGDDVLTVEAGYPSQPAQVTHRSASYFVNEKYGQSITYLESIMNLSELYSVVGD